MEAVAVPASESSWVRPTSQPADGARQWVEVPIMELGCLGTRRPSSSCARLWGSPDLLL